MRLEETYEQFKQLENERKKVVHFVGSSFCIDVIDLLLLSSHCCKILRSSSPNRRGCVT